MDCARPVVARPRARLPSLVFAAARELSCAAAAAALAREVSSRRREKGLYTGTAVVETRKLKDHPLPSATQWCVNVVVAGSRPSHSI